MTCSVIGTNCAGKTTLVKKLVLDASISSINCAEKRTIKCCDYIPCIKIYSGMVGKVGFRRLCFFLRRFKAAIREAHKCNKNIVLLEETITKKMMEVLPRYEKRGAAALQRIWEYEQMSLDAIILVQPSMETMEERITKRSHSQVYTLERAAAHQAYYDELTARANIPLLKISDQQKAVEKSAEFLFRSLNV